MYYFSNRADTCDKMFLYTPKDTRDLWRKCFVQKQKNGLVILQCFCDSACSIVYEYTSLKYIGAKQNGDRSGVLTQLISCKGQIVLTKMQDYKSRSVGVEFEKRGSFGVGRAQNMGCDFVWDSAKFPTTDIQK